MDLHEKAAQLPLAPGVYLYKDAGGRVIYVGKAKSLRARVRSYFSDDRLADVKTGTLISEAARHRLHPGRQRKRGAGAREQPHQAVQAALQYSAARRQDLPLHQADQRKVPARLRHAPAAQGWRHLLRPVLPRQPGASPGALHPPPFSGAVLQGGSHALPSQALPAISHPPLPGAVRGGADHRRSVRRARCATSACSWKAGTATWPTNCARRMAAASEEMRFEEAASLRDLLSTVEEMEERQKMAAAKGDDIDIFAAYAEPPLVALNLFHLRNGQIVDRREFFWEDQDEFDEPQFFSALLKQIYLDQQYIPGDHPRAGGFRGSRSAGRTALGKAQPQGGDPHAAARAEEGPAGPGRDQRQAQFRRALPRDEAVFASHPGSAAGRAEPARRAQAHRVLRYLAHPGHRQSGQHGGVGRRADEEVGLPQVHHPHGDRQRRFRQHARSGDAPLFAPAARERSRCPGWC